MLKSQFAATLEHLCQGKSLSVDQSYSQFEQITQNTFTEIEISAFLTAMKSKGETIDEIVGAILAMRKCAKSFPIKELKKQYIIADCVGTGGDGHHTFNISTTCAVVLACCGIKMAKHGNHAVSSRCGSADLLKSVGVKLDISPEHAAMILEKIGICFLYSPFYHGATHTVRNIRKILGIRTIFNLVGPILNPLQPDYQLLGVYDPKFCHPLANVLKKLGLKRALVVHGSGLDEIAIHGPTQGTLLYEDEIIDFTLSPEEVGIKRLPLEAIKGGNVEYNTKQFQNLLMGNGLPAYQAAVAINAGTLLWLVGKTPSITKGVEMIKNILNTDEPFQRLTMMVELSHAR